MSNLLSRVRRATHKRAEADNNYRAAIEAAREGGHTLVEIAQAAGITMQGVHYLLNPDRRKEPKT